MAHEFRFDTSVVASQIRHRIANKDERDPDNNDGDGEEGGERGDERGGEGASAAEKAQYGPCFGWRSRAFRDQVYVIFLEHAPIPTSVLPTSFLSRMGAHFLDWLVVHAQPKPVFSHAEIMCFSGKLDPSQHVHFSTYMNTHADWQRAGDFYLDGQQRAWRAVPVYDQHGLEGAVRGACTRIHGAPYSVRKYPVAWQGLHWMSRFLENKPHSEGQCADIAARALQLACVDGSILPRHSSTYGPSELYIALAHYLLRSSAPEDALADRTHDGSSDDSSRSDHHTLLDRRRFDPCGAVRKRRTASAPAKHDLDLLYASDAQLAEIGHDDAERQIEQLSDAVIGALHGPVMEESVRCERELATALFRWSNELQRRYNDSSGVRSGDGMDLEI